MWILVVGYCYVTPQATIACKEIEHPQPNLVACIRELPKASVRHTPVAANSVPVTKLRFECKKGGDL